MRGLWRFVKLSRRSRSSIIHSSTFIVKTTIEKFYKNNDEQDLAHWTVVTNILCETKVEISRDVVSLLSNVQATAKILNTNIVLALL